MGAVPESSFQPLECKLHLFNAAAERHISHPRAPGCTGIGRQNKVTLTPYTTVFAAGKVGNATRYITTTNYKKFAKEAKLTILSQGEKGNIAEDSM